MNKILCLFWIFLFCFSPIFPQTSESKVINFSLNDCILKTLENNFDIAFEAFNPALSELSVRRSREKFLPQFSLSYNNSNQNQLTNWFIEGTEYKIKNSGGNFGLRQDLITGGNVYFSLRSSTTDSTRSFVSINPSYQGNLSFEITQPLLKNFGFKINRREIVKALNQKGISNFRFKSTLIQKIYEVEVAYWSLVRAMENIKVREFSLQKSRERMERVVEAEKYGIKTTLDVLESRTQVASLEDSLQSAESNVRMAQENLRKLLNLQEDVSGMKMSIIPTDEPIVREYELSFDEAYELALRERPEMTINQKEIENSNIDVSYYRNQLLPQLDLRFSSWFPGQSGDRLIYKDNDPYSGEVVDIIDGGRSDSMKDVFGFKYKNWSLSLDLNIPLGNIISRASLAEAEMLKEQKLLSEEKGKKTIYYEINETLSEIKTIWKRINSSTLYRELIEKRLDAEEEKFNLGLVGSDWLFNYQERYISAKMSETGAIIDYKLAMAKLERILGTNLKSQNIEFENFEY
ncbi:MAG: TolC family protein [Candidatus Aminicenantes bacterium]|nr:TolC family protein [Candidatus Aminicenantes bacterium]